MGQKIDMPPAVRQYFKRIGSMGGKKQPNAAKSNGGKKGAATRWAHIPRCPNCHRPLPKAQRTTTTPR